jgi:hypothetical protein
MLEQGRAPIYSPLWSIRRMAHPSVRLPDPEHRKWINLLLLDPVPFFINIFDTNDNELQLAGSALGAFQSLENRFTLAEDFWWFGTVASFSQGSQTNSPFTFQLFDVANYGGSAENAAASRHQKKPINAENFFGTAQKPFYLTTPKLFRKDTEVICAVSNSQAVANIIQIVMLGYQGEPNGGLT